MSPLRPGSLVILNSGRCGSTVLTWMLHAHPRIFSRGEVFQRYLDIYEDRRRRPDPIRYLRRDMLRAGKRHFVLSTQFLRHQHLRPDLVDMELDPFVALLRDIGFGHVALLERRNYLRVVLSRHRGSLERKWHVRTREHAERHRFALDPASVPYGEESLPLVKWLEDFETRYAEARQIVASVGGIYLTYEDDVLPDPRIGYRRLCEAMGLDPREVEVPLRRVNPFPVREMLRNFDAVERELRDTRFAWMLDAD